MGKDSISNLKGLQSDIYEHHLGGIYERYFDQVTPTVRLTSMGTL